MSTVRKAVPGRRTWKWSAYSATAPATAPTSASRSRLGLEARCGELHVRASPRLVEARLDRVRLCLLVLRAQRLREAEERPAVVGMPAQVVPVDRLRFARAAGLQQHRAQRLPRGIVPLLRLGVEEAVLQAHRAREM